MGSCEHFGEPRQNSLSVAVASESEGLDREEPSFASPPMVVVSQREGLMSENVGGLGTLEVGGGDLADDCVAPVDGISSSEIAVEKASSECRGGDGSEVVVSDSLVERLQELVLEPLLSLDVGLLVPSAGEDSVVPCVSEQDQCLGLSNDTSATREQDVSCMDGSLMSDTVERNADQINERPGLKCGASDDSLELNKFLSIESGFNKICFYGTHARREMSTFLTNATVDDQVPSEGLQVGGISNGLTVLTEDCNNQVAESSVEIISDFKHAETVDDGSCKSLIMFDKSRADFEGNKNGKTDDDTCQLIFLDTSSSLRRSSRSRKTVQQVQKGKNVLKCSHKAANLPVSGAIDLLVKAKRKKRSCMRRSACSSIWGLPENLSKHFEWSQEFTMNQVPIKGKTKKKPGQRSRKNTTHEAARLQLSEQSQGAPCRPIRLKVTFGKKEERTKVDMPIVGQLGHDALTSAQPVNFETQPHLVSFMESKRGNLTGNLAPKEMLKLGRNSSMSNVLIGGTYMDASSTSSKSSVTCADSLQLESEKLGNLYGDKFLDPGTSPDSEVIDQVLDSNVGPTVLLHDSISRPLSCSYSPKSCQNRRDNKNMVRQEGNPGIVRQCMPCKAKQLTSSQCEINNDFFCDANNALPENPLSNISGSELVSVEFFSVAGDVSHKAPCLDNGADSNSSSRMIGVIESADSGNSNQLVLPTVMQGKRNTKGLQTKGKSKSNSKITKAKRSKKEASDQLKGNKKKPLSKCEVGEAVILEDAHQDRGHPQTDVAGNEGVDHIGETNNNYRVAPQTIPRLTLPPSGVGEQTLPPRLAWVCCDGCGKWRCISAELADAIEATNSRWFCEENQDRAFADCSIPQEKSNAEINAELQISDEEDALDGHLGSKGSGIRQPGEPQQSTWMLIKSNLFLHRSRKTQTVDEVMVCHCKPPAVGTMGCGSQCLNRILSIECVRGTCPCGDLCSNQQFQKQQYAKLSWFRCGKKGYGLQVLEDISEGKFLIEYVGEVLDLHSYEARQKEYASKGHKHFYFMTLNGNEVIDACTKGNVGRFVNHSCDPNCRTEKWVVNGEICVGLFASRNIRKGEELTFDYNYVRVFGAAAKKCYCGSPKCRGYIGGDPLNTEVIVQGDSDEEFPEPVVVDENGEIDHTLDTIMVGSSLEDTNQVLKESDLPEEKLDVISGVEVTVCRSEEPSEACKQPESLIEQEAVDGVHGSSDRLEALETDNERIKPASVQQLKRKNTLTKSPSSKSDVSVVKGIVHKLLSSSVDSSVRMSKVGNTEGDRPRLEACPRMKISRPSKSVKSRRSHSNAISIENAPPTSLVQRTQVSPFKPKKVMEGPANSHLETVEGKLNDLLDAEGGICKKKDSSKGYLKLLLLTAASGDSCNGGAIQSNRELSMILDAILKTKSRGVLVDIVNKNGLQMLHNMIKLYRKDFKKIPILRKLLKVLEFLAERKILSVERVIGDSLRPGVESFRQSILNLTEHVDKKVHQIARNFRDRWLPRPNRRFNGMDNSDWKRDFSKRTNSNGHCGTYDHWREQGARMPEAVDCENQSAALDDPADARMHEASPHLTDTQIVFSRARKRKSRWDQPAVTISPRCFKEQKVDHSSPDKIITSPGAKISKGEEKLATEAREGGLDCNSSDDVMQSSEDDAPPGFSCLQNTENSPPGFSSSLPAQNMGSLESPVVSMGLLQERFNPRMPVAYGIPVSVIQQYGTLKPGTVDSWDVAPAFPFQPFPPLPPYQRDKRACLQARLGESNMVNPSCGETKQENNDVQRGQGMPSSSGESLPHDQNSGTVNQNMLHHGRGSWNAPGRRHYRQNRWNSPRPPWLRNKDGWGF